MRWLMLVALLFVLVGCGSENAEETSVEVAKTFGAGVTLTEVTAISDMLADPEKFDGQTVLVEGTAVAVCEHRGCWFSIASDVEGEKLRFKVEDGVIVFTPDIVGGIMRAEGVFTVNTLDLETTRKICAHNAEEAGEEFDPESITECMTYYQISGSGAVLLKAVE